MARDELFMIVIDRMKTRNYLNPVGDVSPVLTADRDQSTLQSVKSVTTSHVGLGMDSA